MKIFVDLFKVIDGTTKTNSKIDALVDYFGKTNDNDKLWTVAIFSSRRPPRAVNTTLLRQWASELAELPTWLFEETYHIVGDLAETISLVTPNQTGTKEYSLTQIIEELIELKPKDELVKKSYILDKWQHMSSEERFLFNKLITGGFRVGVSQKTIINAISKYLDIDKNTIAHRLMGNWTPNSETWNSLIVQPSKGENQSKPYPFYLAYPLESEVDEIENPNDWSAEWKWDGIRGQVIKRNGEIFIWSRGEDLMTDKFPEFKILMDEKEDNFVIDGEIIPMKNQVPLDFSMLQTRIGRKTISKKQLSEAPIHLIAYDLLEYKSEDIRELPLMKRRDLLQKLIANFGNETNIVFSKDIPFNSWKELCSIRETSRQNNAEGLMLKLKSSKYKVGRKKGEWWKWKVDPMEIDAVMLYAQRGHGRRANLYSDFTFAVWDGDKLVPFAKAYSGLTDVEFKEITSFVKNNTIEKFGPVSSVNPELVFTIAFEGIALSSRHKSGVALRFPRIKRWRKDKSANEADNLDRLKALLS